MKTAVFVGPSWPAGRDIPAPLVSCPPIGRCGVIVAVRAGFRRIAIVDGRFGTEPAVSHKEILWALDQGVEVWGAASMGALRAAELERFGMRGVGAIYDRVRSGQLTSDADVAVLHGPPELGYRPLTVAMVDVEAQLERAAADNVIDPSSLEQWRWIARRIHFAQRTWATVAATGRLAGQPPAACEAIVRHAAERPCSQKEADVAALFNQLQARVPAPAIDSLAIHMTTWLQRDLARAGTQPTDATPPDPVTPPGPPVEGPPGGVRSTRS